MSTLPNDSYALLIGVDDYSGYDPAQNLQGSVNDVAAWQRVCNALGMQPKNVHVLVTSTFKDGKGNGEKWKQRFPGAGSVLEATRDNIITGVKWLATMLAGGKIPGLLTYSGHGDVTADGQLALCPSDVKKDGAGISNLITLHELKGYLAEGNARDLLTVVFDCCHAGLATRGGSLALSLRSDAAPATGARPTLGARELYSCGADEVAYQSEFTSQFHGAFTFALTASLLQWKPVAELGAVRLDVSYEDARSVSQKLLGVLNYTNQTAVLYPPEVGDMPFFHPTTDTDTKEACAAPDGERNPIQLVPNYYTLKVKKNDNTFILLADVFAIKDAAIHVGVGADPKNQTSYKLSALNTECWYIAADAVAKIATAAGIHISSQSLPAGTTDKAPYSLDITLSGDGAGPSPRFESNEDAAWSTSTTTYGSGTSYYFKGTATTPAGEAWIQLNVTTDAAGVATITGVQWYAPTNPLDTATSKTTFDPTSSTAYAAQATARPPATDYKAVSK